MPRFTLPAVNGETITSASASGAAHAISVDPQGATGALLVEGRYSSISPWEEIRTVDLSASRPFRFTGPVQAYRFTLSEMAGVGPVLVDDVATRVQTTGPGYDVSEVGVSPSAAMLANQEALTTQNFNEANSRQGSQYETVIQITNILNATPVYIGFETGDQPVSLKQRDVYGGYVNASYEVFSGATYTGGTAIDAFNNNDLVVRPTLTNITLSPTVTVEGSQFGPVTHLLGSEGIGARLLTTFGPVAGEKILAPNTKYLAKITNVDVAAIGALVVRLYYYEGPLFGLG